RQALDQLLGGRQLDEEGRALGRGALAPDAAAHALDQRLADRKAQPGAALVVLCLLEPAEDARLELFRDAGALVGDAQHDAPSRRAARGEADLAVLPPR